MDIDELKNLIKDSINGYRCNGVDQIIGDYEPSAHFEEFVNFDLSFEGFKKEVKLGGYGQGDFFSYSSIAFWLKGKNQFTKGGISVVKSCCVYISHLAPLAIISYVETQWLKKSTCAPDLGWQGNKIPLELELPFVDWEIFDQNLRSMLTRAGFKVCEKEFLFQTANEVAELAYDLDFENPSNILNSLFYSGIDYSY